MIDASTIAPVAVYRFYDAGDRLLYVGIAKTPYSRWKSHQRQDWWQHVARSDVQWFSSRAEAEAAETAAIQAEEPLLNIRGAGLEKWRATRPSYPRDTNKWSYADVAAHLGVTLRTIYSYKKRDLPAPDGHLGNVPWWSPDTIRRWAKQRPGRGVGGGRPRKDP